MPRPNSVCPDCGDEVLIAITAAGRRQLLNPQPDERGNTAVFRNGAGTWTARVPNDDLPLLPYERIHMPHPATCSRRLVPATVPARPATSPAAPAPAASNVRSLTDHRRRRGNRRR